VSYRVATLLLLVPFWGRVALAATYVGPETCSRCHKDIAASQAKTAMATTWQGPLTTWLPETFDATAADDSGYAVKRRNGLITYSVPNLSLPVDILMGGARHGLGFLVSLKEVDGLPLARPTLIQARYAWSPEQKKLLLAPGCSTAKPQSLEATLGLVLSPTFESRCLECHGRPNSAGSGKAGGVHCEACHGPGSAHVPSSGREGIVNPAKLSNEDSIAICAKCHVGLSSFSDPSPDDLLIANQVRAIRSSDCFLQSGKAFSCTTCHDPHQDAAAGDTRAIQACLGCHSAAVTPHAAICPANAKGGCVGCHMPAVENGPLHLVDHLIRVHSDRTRAKSSNSQIPPITEYLRMIATNSAEAAAAAKDRLDKGESFYKVARETSVDPSAAIGGYLGRKLSVEAVPLASGETSRVIHTQGRWIIFQRLPRDFRQEAEQLQNQAEELVGHGEPGPAIEKAQQALMIYPQFLRAILFIGITFAQNGNPKKGAEVLRTATKLYPQDAKTEFTLAEILSYAGDNAGATEAYKRAIGLEGDFTAAYAKLGLLEYSSNDWQSAIATFRQGLQIDPLSAELNYDLALALNKSGDTASGTQAMILANKLGR
jgi:tetratricopeptide (TPR) repeat protein